jgi:hypothetical protein
MLYQRAADFVTCVEQKRENTRRQPGCRDGLLHRARDEFGCARMRRMGLHDDGTARS